MTASRLWLALPLVILAAIVTLLLLWPRRGTPAPWPVALCGRHPIGGPMVAALSAVAAVAGAGWALFRNPLLWP